MRTYNRERRAKMNLGDVSKRQMITALIASDLRKKNLVDSRAVNSVASFLGFFMWLFSYPYDFIHRKKLMYIFKKRQAKIKR